MIHRFLRELNNSNVHLREIEEEMKERLIEIRNIMEAGGMEDTLNKCFVMREMLQITVGNNEAAKKPAKKGKETRLVKTVKGQLNYNHNAMVDKLIEQAGSQVTIYRNAVNK